MSVVFRECAHAPVRSLSASAPSGYVIGVIGDDGAGKHTLLRLAAGSLTPEAGTVDVSGPALLRGPMDEPSFGQAKIVALYHTLARIDAAARSSVAMQLEQLRRRGGTAFLVSHELPLIEWLSDEVWWLENGAIAAKGDPRQTISSYQHHVAERLRRQRSGGTIALPPVMRRGDGRARLLSIETCDAAGEPASVWRSGEEAMIRVTVRFTEPVADPVIGILLRTRIGFEVYGTNTELEHIALGPRAAGDTIEIVFRFPCLLCPHQYTVTAASHDRDGVWHDWVEDGVAVTVADHRYTAGVARLTARVETRLL